MRTLALSLTLSAVTGAASAQLTLRPDVVTPELTAFHPLPPRDEEFSAQIRRIVQEAGLDRMTPAAESADEEDEWSSICVVDLADLSRPRVAEWCGQNMLYPASTYKMYVLGEAVRQVCAGEISLEQRFTVPEHNVRSGDRLAAGQEVSLSEILRLMCQFSDNTAANMAIDIVDRQRASALLRAMGLEGSDITRKFLPRAREDEGIKMVFRELAENLLPRAREDEGYAGVPGTASCARHFATFLWAAETGAIGGGRGRGLIRAYLAMNETQPDRVRAGLPASATLMSKTGWWSNFSSECGIVEDGPVRYILCVMTAMEEHDADPRIAEFTRRVHTLMSEARP